METLYSWRAMSLCAKSSLASVEIFAPVFWRIWTLFLGREGVHRLADDFLDVFCYFVGVHFKKCLYVEMVVLNQVLVLLF